MMGAMSDVSRPADPRSFDFRRAFHVGVRVHHLETAMAELGATMGITWCTVQERQQPVWTAEGGQITTPLRFTYSAEGPLHVELLEGQPGTIWDANAGAGIHHTGVWVSDVAGETERFLAAGWTLVAAQHAPDAGYGVMTYVQAPTAMIVELVSEAALPRFERWWAGAPSL